MGKRQLLLTVMILSTICVALLPRHNTASAQGDERCFPETGHCISGRIRQFWEQNGGLPVFGFPLGPQQDDFIEGKPFQTQWFERNRLELHPENQSPYDVLLGRLSEDRLIMDGRDWHSFPTSQPQNGCRFFPETNHNVCGRILEAWRANGLEQDGRGGFNESENLALFGLPLSDAQTETLEDGKQYTIQWFERARFELHPENNRPYDVLLGLLGSALYPRQPPSYVPPQSSGDPGAPPPPAPFPPGPIAAPAVSSVPAPVPDQAFLRILNNTGKPVRVTLAGPTPGAWSIVKDRLESRIAPGGYQAIITTDCGTSTTNFSVNAGQTVDLPITCDGPTSELRLVNQTGGNARLVLNGPTSVNLLVGAGGVQTRKIRPGTYSGTVTASCGGVPISFSVKENEGYDLTLSCPGLTAVVKVINNGKEPLRANLIGPTALSFTVPAGQTSTQSVAPGSYQIAVTSACGPESKPFTISDGETLSFTYECVPAQATIVILNDTGGNITVSLSGPTSGNFSASGRETTITVAPGSYSMTVSARCGRQIETFTINNGDQLRFGPYYCTSVP
jgi:hypothetical protein